MRLNATQRKRSVATTKQDTENGKDVLRLYGVNAFPNKLFEIGNDSGFWDAVSYLVFRNN